MSLVSPVFEQHYQDYLQQLGCLDLETIGPALGGSVDPQEPVVSIPYFNTVYRVSSQGITDPLGEKVGYDTCIILCRYLIMGSELGLKDHGTPGKNPEWVGFRDLKESGPLTVYFDNNVEQVIVTALTGRLAEFRAGMAQLNARKPEIDVLYDLAVEIQGLPRIPMLLLFNDAEDGFPGACSVLFKKGVDRFLDAECIAMIGFRLGVLVKRLFS